MYIQFTTFPKIIVVVKGTKYNQIIFKKTEVFIHVTILHRHAILELDGLESTTEKPEIVTEHFYVISPDEKHDQHFTHYCQKLISDYLNSISYEVKTMHEFCDGCAAQYKSRHCFGDLSDSLSEFCYQKLIRNFFETSHAKGPQDAAGGFLKNQADLAVIRGTCIIQDAKGLYLFAKEKLETPKDSTNVRRRIFEYVEEIPREKARLYKPLTGIRSVHQLVAVISGENYIRPLSCYNCEDCIEGNSEQCDLSNSLGNATLIYFTKEGSDNDTSDPENETSESQILSNLITKDCIFAVLCDDNVNEYYVMKASSKSVVLQKDDMDRWGAAYRRGTQVIRGHYFEKSPETPLKYKLIKRKPAIVPSQSVLYIICESSDILDNDILQISEEVHLKILQAVSESHAFEH